MQNKYTLKAPTEKCDHNRNRDEILGHQFNKRLEYFAPCYSQSLLMAGFNAPYTSLASKILTKKPGKQENASLFMNSIL
jgi:hypothetical protein